MKLIKQVKQWTETVIFGRFWESLYCIPHLNGVRLTKYIFEPFWQSVFTGTNNESERIISLYLFSGFNPLWQIISCLPCVTEIRNREETILSPPYWGYGMRESEWLIEWLSLVLAIHEDHSLPSNLYDWISETWLQRSFQLNWPSCPMSITQNEDAVVMTQIANRVPSVCPAYQKKKICPSVLV